MRSHASLTSPILILTIIPFLTVAQVVGREGGSKQAGRRAGEQRAFCLVGVGVERRRDFLEKCIRKLNRAWTGGAGEDRGCELGEWWCLSLGM